uniref:Uncharacterized protein n=1 Tax=Anguilla anguilla TaxID=7936 RepID=A0A0E9SMX3_ANGAN
MSVRYYCLSDNDITHPCVLLHYIYFIFILQARPRLYYFDRIHCFCHSALL